MNRLDFACALQQGGPRQRPCPGQGKGRALAYPAIRRRRRPVTRFSLRCRNGECVQRINETLLSRAERRLLDWACQHMPARISSDMLTALGVGGAVLCFVGYLLADGWLWLAVAGMVLNWIGDSLDGSLARYRRHERPKYGFFLDHMTDTLAIALIMVGIGLSPHVNLAVALAALGAYYAMTILTMATCIATGVFRISFGGLGPTEIRLVIAACTVAAILLPVPAWPIAGTQLSIYDGMMAAVTAGLVFTCLSMGQRTARELAALDPGKGQAAQTDGPAH